ncbi:MAG: peptidase [Bacteroidota bacterium]|jgi:predicted Zn-dependent peptidase|nr:peptidase [Bacteroidota bacterium]
MTLNRKIAPEFKTIEKIDIQHAVEHTLSNGIKVFTIDSGSQELTKIEFLFKAGMYYQSQPLLASATNNLLETGTTTYSANELSDNIDFFGSFFECSVDQDYASLALYSLNKYLDKSLHYVEDIIKHPTFPKDEFDIYMSNKKQKHIVNSEKVNVLARRRFTELIFGEKHPYGIAVKDEDFDKLKVEDLKAFYKTHYHSGNCTIIASGKLSSNLIDTLNHFFGKESWGDVGLIQSPSVMLDTTKQRTHFIEKPDAIQSAVRVGRLLFNKKDPDYFKFQVLNTVLGGYFGSRLMANIREDKGYTYGIGSGLASLVNGGYFFISTEVGVDVTNNTLSEIYKEIKLLREQPVNNEELETVRNYVLGQFLRSVDGPYSLADKFKAIWEFGLGYDYFENYFKAVKTITPKEIQELANKYLQEEDLIELVVGKK